MRIIYVNELTSNTGDRAILPELGSVFFAELELVPGTTARVVEQFEQRNMEHLFCVGCVDIRKSCSCTVASVRASERH